MTRASNRDRSRRTVLIETRDPYGMVSACIPLLDSGYDVVLCAGPRNDQTCAALDGLPCPFVQDASVVVNAIDDAELQSAVASAVRAVDDSVPVAVINPRGRDATRPAGSVPFASIGDFARQLQAVRRPRSSATRNVTGCVARPVHSR